MKIDIKIRKMGTVEYSETYQKMFDYTASRQENSDDELWILEHNPVYTQGQAGKEKHILKRNHIPIIKTDRGGQITYHGPGQLIVYILIDIKRRGIGIRQLVDKIENSVVKLLANMNINAYSKKDAPGVYVDNQKICSLGLKIKKGCSFHGLALNYNMDLSPFDNINPCGFSGMKMTNISKHIPVNEKTKEEIINNLINNLILEINNHKVITN